MTAYQSSTVSPLFSNENVYDNYLGKIVAGAVVANQKISKAIVAANRDNPSKRQGSFNSSILEEVPQYIPQAVETIIETPNPYAQVNDAFDYIVRTNTLLGGGSRALRSSINQALKNDREARGDFSFIRPIAPVIVYRTLNTPYRYNLSPVDNAGRPSIFEVGYALPYVKIKQTLTKGEYVNHWIFRNRHDLHNLREWRSDVNYNVDDDGNIVIELTNNLFEPALLVPGYDASHRYTFMEYMVVVGSVGNLARGVYAYNHTVNNNRDTIMDNLLVANLEERFGDPLTGKFYPIIPMRRNNTSTKAQIPTRVKELLKSNYDMDLDEYFTKLSENASIGEIDDCYLVHGVPLNSKKQSHKRYLFEFFDGYLAYSNNLKLTIQNNGFIIKIFSNLFGKVTDTSFTAAQQAMAVNDVSTAVDGNIIQISKRFEDRIETINIRDLSHTTVIANGGTVVIHAQTALADLQYDEFMLPLHAPTMERLDTSDRISVSGADLYFVANAYGVISRKWWEPFLEIFIVALQATAVILALVFPPAGVLGKLSGVIVTGLGITGTGAIIAGAIVNAVAAALVSKGILKLGGDALGDKGAVILAAVVSILLAGGINGNFNPLESWAQLNNLSKGNLITNALADIYAIINEEELESIRVEANRDREEYETAIDKLNKRIKEISPNSSFSTVYSSIQNQQQFYEEPQSFLDRTLFVGSDLVELNDNIVNNYVDNSLKLPIIGTN